MPAVLQIKLYLLRSILGQRVLNPAISAERHLATKQTIIYAAVLRKKTDVTEELEGLNPSTHNVLQVQCSLQPLLSCNAIYNSPAPRSCFHDHIQPCTQSPATASHHTQTRRTAQQKPKHFIDKQSCSEITLPPPAIPNMDDTCRDCSHMGLYSFRLRARCVRYALLRQQTCKAHARAHTELPHSLHRSDCMCVQKHQRSLLQIDCHACMQRCLAKLDCIILGSSRGLGFFPHTHLLAHRSKPTHHELQVYSQDGIMTTSHMQDCLHVSFYGIPFAPDVS